MKKIQLLLLLGTLLFCWVENSATHIAGGDIYYEHLGGNDYRITAYFYRDCSGIPPRTGLPVYFSSPNCGSGADSLYPTGVETILSPACNNQLTTCEGGSATGILKIEYANTITLPNCVNGTDWTFAWEDNGRNYAITNVWIDQFNGTPLYLEATLDHANSNGNTSPVFSNDPVSFVCIGQNFTFNHGAIDPDGDSLAYSFVDPVSAAGTPVSWNAGFNATNPITSSTPITLDPVTGDLNFTPSAIEVDILAIRVDEYRAGKLIGSTVRDMQIWVTSCGNNTLPTLSGIDGTNVYNTATCAGDLVAFDVFASDVDGDNLTVSWNQGINGATFTPSNNNTQVAEGKFTWTPTPADISNTPHVFTVTVKDDACPSIGQQIFTYSILVSGITSIPGTVTDESCQGAFDGSIALNLSNIIAPYTISWNNGGSSDTLNNLTAGTYIVTVTDSAGCSGVDTFVVGTGGSCCVYEIVAEDSVCPGNTTCVWLEASQVVSNGIIGMNYCINYDTAFFTPTGNATLGQVVYAPFGGPSNIAVVQLNTNVPGQVYTSIFYNGAQPNDHWQGQGEVICVEFLVKPNTPVGSYNFSACEVEEGYDNIDVTQCAIPGDLGVAQNSDLTGQIQYWDYDGTRNGPARPLMYDVNSPSDYLITTVNATNGSGVWTHTDLNGEFSWNANDGNAVIIDRDIFGSFYDTVNCTDVFPFINGADAYLAALISNFDMVNLLDSDSAWIPNKYQMIAGDVNMNDKVRANDVTRILTRSVRNICEFPQVWNYTLGTPSQPLPDTNLGVSRDWRFLATPDTSAGQVAGVLAEWTFENIATPLPALPILPSYSDAVVTTAGADVIGGNNNGSPAVCTGSETWSTNFWTTDSIADSLEYIEYSILLGASVQATSFDFILNASSAYSAYNFDLYYDLNGIMNYLGSSMADTVACTSQSYSLNNLNLNPGDVLSFRIFPYGQTAQFQSAALRMDNVVINGLFTNSSSASKDCFPDPNYPVYVTGNSSGGYWRDDVPDLSDTVIIFTPDTTSVCPNYAMASIDAILLGDLTGTWDPSSAFGTNVRASSQGTMNFNVYPVTTASNEYMIEVSYNYASPKASVDFRMDYNESNMTIINVQSEQAAIDANMNVKWNDHNAEKLYLSSYTMDGIETTDVLYTIHVKMNNYFNVSDLGTILPMINGEIVNTNITVQNVTGSNEYELAGYFEVYPNPSNGIVMIDYAMDQVENVNLTLTNALGQVVLAESLGNMSRLTSKQLDLTSFEKGVYNLKLSGNNGEIVKRIILQ
ncbi:MAG: T9SS type A sorting domain-containing protein, partial [Flavobacteriales bacterium]|nr:T9SS type A sorting domain-containing protein [Flavobacteriales bacterium]